MKLIKHSLLNIILKWCELRGEFCGVWWTRRGIKTTDCETRLLVWLLFSVWRNQQKLNSNTRAKEEVNTSFSLRCRNLLPSQIHFGYHRVCPNSLSHAREESSAVWVAWARWSMLDSSIPKTHFFMPGHIWIYLFSTRTTPFDWNFRWRSWDSDNLRRNM